MFKRFITLIIFGVITIFSSQRAYSMKRARQQAREMRPDLNSLISFAQVYPDPFMRILSFLPEYSWRATAGTCQFMHSLIMGNKDSATSLAFAVEGAAQRLQVEQLDPIGYVLQQAKGQEFVKIYGYTVRTADLVNTLLASGQRLSRTILGFADVPMDQLENPYFDRFVDELKVPAGVIFDQAQLNLCKRRVVVSVTNEESRETIVSECKKAQQAHPDASILVQLSNCVIAAGTFIGCQNLPIVSVVLNDCIFDDEGLACLLPLQQIQHLEVWTRKQLPNPFPAALCQLHELTAVSIVRPF